MNPYLLPTIEFAPTLVRRILRLIPESRLDEVLEAGRFTPREVVAHLADWEPIMRERMQMGLSRPGATIEALDEVRMAQENGYAQSDPVKQCERFAEERRITAEFLRKLQAADWHRTIFHPERGTLSTLDQANLILGHDLYHIEQLSAYLP